MPKLVPGEKPPRIVSLYAAMILVGTVIMYWTLIDSSDPDDDTFAAFWLVMFALPSSVIFGIVGEIIGINALGPPLFVLSGIFQVWLLWTWIESRRTFCRDRERD